MNAFCKGLLFGLLILCFVFSAAHVASAQFPGFPPYPAPFPPPYPPPFPAVPVYQSLPTITGVMPGGGINTAGTTVFGSAYDPYRNMSMGNGTLRPVNRPKFDAYGRIIGYETGTEWNNSVTGQVHSNLQVIRPNGMGGWNQQTQAEMHSERGRWTQPQPTRSIPRH